MKVCYWTPNSIGGAGKYERYLPKEISKIRKDIIIKIVRRPKNVIKGNPIFLKCYYRDYNSDIIHATSQALCIYSFPKPKNFLITVHDIHTLYRSIKFKIKRFFIKKFLNRADKIIAVSKFTKREIIEQIGIEDDKITVIPLGVDLNLYKPMDKNYCRRVFGLENDKKYILIVASNAPHKRMDISIAVFLKVKKYFGNNVRLIKCGYGHKLYNEDVINTGLLPEHKMPFLYNAADVLLHTSEYEGFGVPLLEAMACGLPIVASKKASIPEVIGDCGYLIDIDSDTCIDDFTEAILNILDNENEKRNYKGIERSKMFSWANCAKKTLKIYDEMLK